MSAWYDRINNTPPMPQAPAQNVSVQAFISNAFKNLPAFVKEQFPDVPDNIINNPNEILKYLQESRGISQEQINQIISGSLGRG